MMLPRRRSYRTAFSRCRRATAAVAQLFSHSLMLAVGGCNAPLTRFAYVQIAHTLAGQADRRRDVK